MAHTVTADAMREAIQELTLASEQMAIATESLNQARRQETDATNRLNAAQKRFDALVAAMKEEAPRGSDWRTQRNERGSISWAPPAPPAPSETVRFFGKESP